MPCLLSLIALFFPRVVIVMLVIFSDYLGRAFQNEWWWPLAGFFFMPFTTLAYAFGMNHGGGIKGVYVVLVVLGVLMDFGVIGGGAASRRRKSVVVKRVRA